MNLVARLFCGSRGRKSRARPKGKINPPGIGRVNIYICQKCGRLTYTVHEDDPPGVTPFLIKCRALRTCTGMARSTFYPSIIPDPLPKIHIHWFRPSNDEELMKYVERYSKEVRDSIIDHVNLGGCLSREH